MGLDESTSDLEQRWTEEDDAEHTNYGPGPAIGFARIDYPPCPRRTHPADFICAHPSHLGAPPAPQRRTISDHAADWALGVVSILLLLCAVTIAVLPIIF